MGEVSSGQLCCTETYRTNVPYERKLLDYAYFQQARLGDVEGTDFSQPWFFSQMWSDERAKWDAWYQVKGMSKEEAMKKYVEEIKKQKVEFPPLLTVDEDKSQISSDGLTLAP